MARPRPHPLRARPRRGPLQTLRWAGLTLLLSAWLAPAAHASARFSAANWDRPAQRLLVAQGIMGEVTGQGFAGEKPLSASAAASALGELAEHEALAPLAVTITGTVSVTRFDALLVSQLGLADVAEHIQRVARAAGLMPPAYFGSEVVARDLQLRYEHPTGEQALDLYPWEPITRAEAAHSLALALQQGRWALDAARETLMAFSLPHYNAAQLTVLRLAVSKIGMPYVWGGTTDGREDGLEHGGYDCSGFAWRIYKVSGSQWGAQIGGRTAAQQAGEIPKSRRIARQDVDGGDLLFFGSAHFGSRATEASVIHEGIALSNEWVIHSSDQGVYVLPLDSGWLASSFAWARRVL